MIKVCFNDFDKAAIAMNKDDLSDEDEQEGLTKEQKLLFINNQKKVYLVLRNIGYEGVKITPLAQEILEFFLDKYINSMAYGQAYVCESKLSLLKDLNNYFNYELLSFKTRQNNLKRSLDILIQLELIDYLDENEQIKRNQKIIKSNKKCNDNLELLNYDISNKQVIIRLKSCNSYAPLLGVVLDG